MRWFMDDDDEVLSKAGGLALKKIQIYFLEKTIIT